MSDASSVQPELPSASNISTISPITSIRSAKPKLSRPITSSPINGVVGHTFIRLCLWFDLLSSWKKQSYTPPTDGFLNFGAREAQNEAVPHPAAN
jgi:hypothetical protein